MCGYGYNQLGWIKDNVITKDKIYCWIEGSDQSIRSQVRLKNPEWFCQVLELEFRWSQIKNDLA